MIDPVCALVFEAERDEANIMQRPPRNSDKPLFSFAMVAWSVFQGVFSFATLATLYFFETWVGMPDGELRALIFFALIAEILALILVNRSFSASLGEAFIRHNTALRYLIAAILTITGVILFWPRAQVLLKFESIEWSDMALAAGLGILLLVMLEGFKPAVRRAFARSKASATPLHAVAARAA